MTQGNLNKFYLIQVALKDLVILINAMEQRRHVVGADYNGLKAQDQELESINDILLSIHNAIDKADSPE